MSTPPLTLSQAQVCEYTGYSVATVRMLERKGRPLRLRQRLTRGKLPPLTPRFQEMSRDMGPVLVPVRGSNQQDVAGKPSPGADVPHAGLGVELPGHFQLLK